MNVLIIADDLSGAADCAVGFACAGHRTIVAVKPSELQAPGGDCNLAVDTDTRRLAPAEAGERTATAFAALRSEGRRLYKKVDSTLRGNWAAEVARLVPLAGLAIVAPAHPALGRTVKGGRVFLHGQALEATETWQLEHRHRPADIATQLRDAGLSVELLDVDAAVDQPASLAERIGQLATRQVDALIVGAQTVEALHCLAMATLPMTRPMFWVGSGGLAREIAELLPKGRAWPTEAPDRAPGPTLIVAGSLSAITERQTNQLANCKEIETIVVPPGVLRDGTSQEAWQAWQARIGEGLNGGDVLLKIGQDNHFDPAEGARLSTALARLAGPYFDRLGGLIATGGETARAMLVETGVDHLLVLGELETGVVVGTPVGSGRSQHPRIVTKAGAFGGDDTLLNAWLSVRRARDPRTQNLFKEQLMKADLPIIGITMGDAAGVGPEVIVKTLGRSELYQRCRPLVIGDSNRLQQANRIVGGQLAVHSIQGAAEAHYEAGTIDCIDLGLIPEDLPFGRLSAVAGDAAFRYIQRAAELAQAGQIDAICTAPLNKEALHAGGHKFPGHTEMLAHLTGVDEVSMMLVAPQLRVIHVTTHIGIIDAIRKIEPGLVRRTIQRGHDTLVKAGLPKPRIGVCGINPHAGENGLFGYGEEEEKIIPAVTALQKEGLDVTGPLPADTLFFRAGRGDFDLVVAMYHDQGHGPVKVLGLEAGVNVTVGLDVIRTSVDHGTAFDIAGTGVVDDGSMVEAMRQAIDLAVRHH